LRAASSRRMGEQPSGRGTFEECQTLIGDLPIRVWKSRLRGRDDGDGHKDQRNRCEQGPSGQHGVPFEGPSPNSLQRRQTSTAVVRSRGARSAGIYGHVAPFVALAGRSAQPRDRVIMADMKKVAVCTPLRRQANRATEIRTLLRHARPHGGKAAGRVKQGRPMTAARSGV
jgi:hypothetical protein